jgi:peptide/nickel transport system substrate-binding protein
MNMTRRAVLMTSAAIAANVLRPELSFAQATPRRGGVFTVHYGAEQRQLNPSLQASTGVYIIGGKILARRQDHHSPAASGRDLA